MSRTRCWSSVDSHAGGGAAHTRVADLRRMKKYSPILAGREAFNPVQQNSVWRKWCSGTERAAHASAHAVRQSCEPPVDPRDGKGDYGLRTAHQMHIEPLNETRQGRLQRVKARLPPVQTPPGTGHRTLSWPPQNAFDPGGWPPEEPSARTSWHLNDGFHTTQPLQQQAAHDPMTRAHRSSLAASSAFRRGKSARFGTSATRGRSSGGSRSLSPRRGRMSSPTGLCRNSSLIDPRREERVMRLYHETHRRRRDDPHGLNVPPTQTISLEYYDKAASVNMLTGKVRANTLKLLQL